MTNQKNSLDCNQVQIKKGNVTISCEPEDVGTFLKTLTIGDAVEYNGPNGKERATKVAETKFMLEEVCQNF